VSHNPWIWVSALLTLAVFTFLIKDNVFYRTAEHIFVGVSAAWLFATYFQSDIIEDMLLKAFPGWFHQPGAPNYLVLGGGVIGLLILLRLVPGINWISRWGVAFVVGFQTGLQLYTAIKAWILAQLKATLLSFYVAGHIRETIKNWILVSGTFSSLSYFYFSKEQKGWFGGLTRVGIWFLMIGFGASYGATVMTRISILLGRIYFLLSTWLGVVH
jgi:hypothetical protein